MNALRVLVVDDSVVYRKLMSELLSTLPNVVVVGTASNGRVALTRLEELTPDLVTLDIEMPEMDGLALLEELRTRNVDVGVLMVSSHTVRGGELTIRALELGAFDFVTKPERGVLEANRASLTASLKAILTAYAARRRIHGILRSIRPPAAVPLRSDTFVVPGPALPSRARPNATLVLIGVSTGGPNALAQVVPAFPADFTAPVVIVQHMPETFTRSLASSLDAKSLLRVKEADDGETLQGGTVYIAPGGRQMRLVEAAGHRIVEITNDPPEQNCKPSVDYLFRSVSHHAQRAVVGVIMTGMGSDGTLGARLLKRAGATIFAQDEATSVVFGMPKAVIDAGVVDRVCPLDGIAAEICRTVWGNRE